MRPTLVPHRPPAVLAAADLVALAAFVTVGLLSHRGGISATGYARDLVPIAGAWGATAVALGTYRRHSTGRVVATWAVGVTVGILVRAAVVDRGFGGSEAAFLGVALAFTALFVAAGRLALGLAPVRQA